MALIFWIFLSLLVGLYAHLKGRSGFLFFLLSMLLSPLIALIFALIIGPKSFIYSPKRRRYFTKDADVIDIEKE